MTQVCTELLASPEDKTRLGQFLRRHQLVSQADLDDALGKQQQTGLHLGELLTQAQRLENSVVETLLHEQQHVRSLLVSAEHNLVHAVTRLGVLLHLHGYVSEEQLQEALQKQNAEGGRLGDILLREGHIGVQHLHDALTHQVKLRSVLVTTLASLVMAGTLAPLPAEAGSSDSASVTITLQILPPQPEVLLNQQLDGQDLQVTGATFHPDGVGGYIVQPLESTPSGMPSQSMQFQVDENATGVQGVMNIFVVPR